MLLLLTFACTFGPYPLRYGSPYIYLPEQFQTPLGGIIVLGLIRWGATLPYGCCWHWQPLSILVR